jgi:peptide/nickel transport system permease protein
VIATAARVQVIARPSAPARTARTFARRWTAVLGLALVLTVVLAAIAAPVIAPYTPTERVGDINGPATIAHPLGTDRLGRDVLSRVIHGARASLVVGLGAEALGLVIGALLGMAAGYLGGRTDVMLMRVVDVFMAFPFILLAILVVAAIGPGTQNVILAMGLTSWTGTARILRSETLRLREEGFVEAARVLGASHSRILFRHVSPNLVPMALTLASIGIGAAIIGESSLSFLGLGIRPPAPSWGLDLSFGRTVIFSAPQLTIAPALAIFVAVLGFNLLGDGLRDVLDPREGSLIG